MFPISFQYLTEYLFFTTELQRKSNTQNKNDSVLTILKLENRGEIKGKLIPRSVKMLELTINICHFKLKTITTF